MTSGAVRAILMYTWLVYALVVIGLMVDSYDSLQNHYITIVLALVLWIILVLVLSFVIHSFYVRGRFKAQQEGREGRYCRQLVKFVCFHMYSYACIYQLWSVPVYAGLVAIFWYAAEGGEGWAGWFYILDAIHSVPVLICILLLTSGFRQDEMHFVSFYLPRISLALFRFITRLVEINYCVDSDLADLMLQNGDVSFEKNNRTCEAFSFSLVGSLAVCFIVSIFDFYLTINNLAQMDYMETRFRQIVLRFVIFVFFLSVGIYLVIYAVFYLSWATLIHIEWPGALLMLRPMLISTAISTMSVAFLPPTEKKVLCFALEDSNPYEVSWGDVALACAASYDAYYDPPFAENLSKSGWGPLPWSRRGYRVLGAVRNEETDAHCLVAEITNEANNMRTNGWSSREGDLVLAFRGTVSWSNVLSDLQVSRQPLPFDLLLPRFALDKTKGKKSSHHRDVRVRGNSVQISTPSVESLSSKLTTNGSMIEISKSLNPNFLEALDGNRRSSIPQASSPRLRESYDGGQRTKPSRNSSSKKSFATGWVENKSHRANQENPGAGVLTWLLRERVHSGFLDLYTSLRKDLLHTLDPLLAPPNGTNSTKPDSRGSQRRRPTGYGTEKKFDRECPHEKDRKTRIKPRPYQSGTLLKALYFRAPLSENAIDGEEGLGTVDNSRRGKKRIFITGHSLGAALATIAALDLKTRYHGEYDVRLVNIASPRVGDHSFARLFKNSIPHALRVVNSRDIVPGLPKFFCLFKHIGHEVTIDRKGNILIDPSAMEKVFIKSRSTSYKAHAMEMYTLGVKACLQRHCTVRERKYVEFLLDKVPIVRDEVSQETARRTVNVNVMIRALQIKGGGFPLAVLFACALEKPHPHILSTRPSISPLTGSTKTPRGLPNSLFSSLPIRMTSAWLRSAPRSGRPHVLTTSAARRGGSSLRFRCFASSSRPIKKVMAANRGEIAIRIFRAAKELGMDTVAIYPQQDRRNLHVRKADESFQLNVDGKLGPVEAYLNIDEIIDIALKHDVDAIHPGYGFLSERGEFTAACENAGITFIGPSSQAVDQMGSKTEARELAAKANVPVVPGSDGVVRTVEEALAFAETVGYPIMAKAAFGGGGRGMRLCRSKDELAEGFVAASSEARAAFGDGSMFLEKFVVNPRHIEVQIMGDKYGNHVHLFERDCSVQRRHQKIVEIAPAPLLSQETRKEICDHAVALAKASNYQNAGTCEFLVDEDGAPYFIEMNARLQVEHTITEEITGVDLVQTQLRVAQGESLPDMGLTQDKITMKGCAIQCRMTTEDPNLNFAPDTGRLELYQVGEGMGIRLDQSGYQGLVISPYYDSLLAKIIARGRDHQDACTKLHRALSESRVRGVKTNIEFVKKVLEHPDFYNGAVDTGFIDKNPDLFNVKTGLSVAMSIVKFLGEQTVNGPLTPIGTDAIPERTHPPLPKFDETEKLTGLRDVFVKEGAAGFAKAVRENKGVLFTDTTWRDAHQSLLATRVRTKDIMTVAPATGSIMRNAYSIENWGGATFDVALRFLRECPWDRLEEMREAVPHVPFQMLLRGANAVGYTAYPDNVVYKFCDQAVKSGMDVFRVFDSLNYVENLRLGMDAVGAAGGIIEAAISYTGDVSDPNCTKYNLDYYLNLTDELVKHGTHVLAIKDMAGLLKPRAATMLVGAIRKEFPDLPIHVHTHDTSGNGVAAMLECVRAGADAIDASVDSMSGMTAQPSMGALVAALNAEGISSGISNQGITTLSEYWEAVRPQYAPFECTATMRSGSADVYEHQIPGGQYTNLHFQAFSMGQADQWPLIKKAYRTANLMLGDIVKVTPSSKVVGDFALFMVQNGLESEADVLDQADTLSFPSSVIEFFQGYLGQPVGGFPEPLRSKVLKTGTPKAFPPVEGRPGADLDDYDFENEKKKLTYQHGETINDKDVLSHALYPKVFDEYMEFKSEYGAVKYVPTYAYFSPIKVGEEVKFDIRKGKEFILKLVATTETDTEGNKQVFFDVNGVPLSISVPDKSSTDTSMIREKADKSSLGSVGAPMPGQVLSIKVDEGTRVAKDTSLVVLSAMKMETVVTAPVTGLVKRIVVSPGDQVQGGDLLVEIDEKAPSEDKSASHVSPGELAPGYGSSIDEPPLRGVKV
ncbi:hypothetical protein AAMO2058_000101000 [Amorphochlora amoebiformis]